MKREKLSISRNIPGPEPTPILGAFGNLLSLWTNPIHRMSELFEKYGPVVALSRGGGTSVVTPGNGCPGTVLAFGPDMLRQVETQHEIYHKSVASGRLYPVGEVNARKKPFQRWGTGLFAVNGNEHREHRKLLMPAFHKKRIEAYRDAMVALTEQTLDQWVVGQARNIHADMMQLTLRIVTTTLFGEDLAGEDRRVLEVFHKTFDSVTSPTTILAPFDIAGTPYHRLLNLVAQFDADMRIIVERRRRSGANGDDMLSMLIQTHDEDGTRLTEDELIGHVEVIFAAGHETSTNALTWTLFLLSQHPHIAAALVDELQSTLKGNPPTVAQLDTLPLLDRVVKESLRVLPPVPFNHRIVADPTELGGYHLPDGTEVLLSIYHTHHMPSLYPESASFRPDRWLTINPSPFEYNPFSAGPRMCIGASFAWMEIKIVLAMLLQAYRTQLVPGSTIDPKTAITMGPRRGMPMKIYQQDGRYAGEVEHVVGGIRELVDLPQ